MKTVIMAGGRGTRMSSVASDIPKPMIKIERKPVLAQELHLADDGLGLGLKVVERWCGRSHALVHSKCIAFCSGTQELKVFIFDCRKDFFHVRFNMQRPRFVEW